MRFTVIPTLLLTILLCLVVGTSFSKEVTNKYYTLSYEDSVVLDENSKISLNSFRFLSASDQETTVGIEIKIPTGWRPINKINTEESKRLLLRKDERLVVPVNLLYRSNIVSKWDDIQLKVWINGTTDTFFHALRIRVKEKPDFLLNVLTSEQTFVTTPDSVTIRYKLRNVGNTDDTYTVKFDNSVLKISGVKKVFLPAATDSTLEFSFKTKASTWNSMYKQIVTMNAESQKLGTKRFGSTSLTRAVSTLTENEKSYVPLPITLSGGVIANGPSVTYFGRASLYYCAGFHRVSFNYSSQQLGAVAYTVQPHAFNFLYGYKGFEITGGQIRGAMNFYSVGQGIGVRYEDPIRKFGIGVSALKHAQYITESNFQNDNIYGYLHYKVKNVLVNHIVETNSNSVYQTNSYLLNNEIVVFNKTKIALKVNGGIGINQQQMQPLAFSIENITKGYNAGYNLSINAKRMFVNSNVQYNSIDYPGIYRGLHNQYHMAGFGRGMYFFSAVLTYNSMTQNALRDTLFSSDYLTTNALRYGISASHSNKKHNYSIATGVIKQRGRTVNIPNGNYFDVGASMKLLERYNFSLFSRNAYQPQISSRPAIFSTNSTLKVSTPHLSIIAMYNRLPLWTEKSPSVTYRETIDGGPTVFFDIFNHKLGGSLRYNISKTLSERTIRNGVGGTLNFVDDKIGMNISLNGFYPLKDPGNIDIPLSQTKYGTLTYSQRINFPVKKLDVHNLKVVLFKDENNNDVFDGNEEPLANVAVNINDKDMVTNSEGIVQYKKVNPGVYSINLQGVKVGDLVPSKGSMQSVDLRESTVLYCSFKKGKKIYGNLHINLDTLSTTYLAPDNFRIDVTDTSGNKYNTLTDSKGDFYLFVPDGYYTVSISADYFKNTDFKPEQLNFTKDLTAGDDKAVQFTINQKKRVIRYMTDKK